MATGCPFKYLHVYEHMLFSRSQAFVVHHLNLFGTIVSPFNVANQLRHSGQTPFSNIIFEFVWSGLNLLNYFGYPIISSSVHYSPWLRVSLNRCLCSPLTQFQLNAEYKLISNNSLTWPSDVFVWLLCDIPIYMGNVHLSLLYVSLVCECERSKWHGLRISMTDDG